MLVQPRKFQVPEEYDPYKEPIAGTERLAKRFPRWFAEFGLTPDMMLSLVHIEHKRDCRPFSERRSMRWTFNGKELDHNQRRRFWDEMIKWQALLIKQLASRNQHNAYYFPSEAADAARQIRDWRAFGVPCLPSSKFSAPLLVSSTLEQGKQACAVSCAACPDSLVRKFSLTRT